MVLTKPHMKPGIQFIIMKIFMKIVKICPKSPRFTVHVTLQILLQFYTHTLIVRIRHGVVKCWDLHLCLACPVAQFPRSGQSVFAVGLQAVGIGWGEKVEGYIVRNDTLLGYHSTYMYSPIPSLPCYFLQHCYTAYTAVCEWFEGTL